MNGAIAVDWQILGRPDPVPRPAIGDATTWAIRGRDVRAVRWVASPRRHGLVIELSGGVRLITRLTPPPRYPADGPFPVRAFYPAGHADQIAVDPSTDDLPSWPAAESPDYAPLSDDADASLRLLESGIATARTLDSILYGKVANLLYWVNPDDGSCDSRERYDLEFTDYTYLQFDLNGTPSPTNPIPWVSVSEGG